MKIYVGGANYPDSFAENIRETLVLMGHEVASEPSGSMRTHYNWILRIAKLITSAGVNSGPTLMEKQMLARVRAFKPDLFLSSTAYFTDGALEVLQEICPRRVLWWGDAPSNLFRLGYLNPAWSIVYQKDRAAVEKLKMVGVRSKFLPEAMNPVWHKPVAEQENDGVVVAGNYYSFRQALCLRLLKDKVPLQLYGSDFPIWTPAELSRQRHGGYITRLEKSKVYGAGLACLNSFSFAEGDSINCRAFEVAGAGGLQLLEYRPCAAEFFEPGKEVLVYRSYEELLAHLDRAKKEPLAMKGIRKAAAARALADHTYRHRLEKILQDLS